MHMLHYFFKKTFRMSANMLLSFKLTFTGTWANTFCGLVMSVQAAVQLTRPFMSSCWPNQGLWYSLTAEWQPCTCKSLVCKLLQDFQHSCNQSLYCPYDSLYTTTCHRSGWRERFWDTEHTPRQLSKLLNCWGAFLQQAVGSTQKCRIKLCSLVSKVKSLSSLVMSSSWGKAYWSSHPWASHVRSPISIGGLSSRIIWLLFSHSA